MPQAVVEVGLAGIDREEKARRFKLQLMREIDCTKYSIISHILGDPGDTYQIFRIEASSSNPKDLQIFTQTANSLLLRTFPGAFFPETAKLSAKHITTHWPTRIRSERLSQTVHVNSNEITVQPTSQQPDFQNTVPVREAERPDRVDAFDDERTGVRLNEIFGLRSGDKGGNANLGVWAKTPEAYLFLLYYLTPDRLRSLAPDMMGDFEIVRHELPGIQAVNFVIKGILGDGVASNKNIDKQAKALGEVIGAQQIEAPIGLSTQSLG